MPGFILNNNQQPNGDYEITIQLKAAIGCQIRKTRGAKPFWEIHIPT